MSTASRLMARDVQSGGPSGFSVGSPNVPAYQRHEVTYGAAGGSAPQYSVLYGLSFACRANGSLETVCRAIWICVGVNAMPAVPPAIKFVTTR